jgi:hypothetical protein
MTFTEAIAQLRAAMADPDLTPEERRLKVTRIRRKIGNAILRERRRAFQEIISAASVAMDLRN